MDRPFGGGVVGHGGVEDSARADFYRRNANAKLQLELVGDELFAPGWILLGHVTDEFANVLLEASVRPRSDTSISKKPGMLCGAT